MLTSEQYPWRYRPEQLSSFTTPTSEIFPLHMRALNLSVVGTLTCICFPFSRMGIYQVCPRLLSLPSVTWLDLFGSIFRLMPPGELDTTSQPPLGFCSVKYCIRFLLFPAPCASPSGFWGRTSAPRPLECTVFLVNHVWLRSR